MGERAGDDEEVDDAKRTILVMKVEDCGAVMARCVKGKGRADPSQRTFPLEFKRGRRQSLTVLQKTSKQNKNNSNGQNLQVLVTNVKNNVKTINF